MSIEETARHLRSLALEHYDCTKPTREQRVLIRVVQLLTPPPNASDEVIIERLCKAVEDLAGIYVAGSETRRLEDVIHGPWIENGDYETFVMNDEGSLVPQGASQKTNSKTLSRAEKARKLRRK